jgi:GntR family galactonate operon transcriptional repressor
MNEMLFYDLKARSGLTLSLCSQVASEMGRRIVTGRYAPGSLVDDEGTLSERFQVSRTVIRDAVKILVGKGLLDVRRGIGTRVKDRRDWGLLDDDVLAWQLSGPPEASTLQQLMEVRQVFEPRGARWAASRASVEDLQEIGAACDLMDAEINNAEQFVVADARFHRAVLRAAHNEFLSALDGVIYSTLLFSIRLTNPNTEANALSLPLHRSVYEAIKSGDTSLAESRMNDLLEDASRRMSELAPTS